MAETNGKPGSFTVTDHRAFDATGERKAEDAPTEPAASPEVASGQPPKLANAAPPSPKTEAPRSLPPADFATLVLSLGSSVLMYMGEAPEGTKAQRNMPMAKHAIDLLTVLEEKTKGNLSTEEEHILGSLLFDLRLRYVEALKTTPASGS
jgi:hypothetical protein